MNVERWCHLQCIHERRRYEWFRWKGWTEAFVRWVLAHGDDAADRICPWQVRGDAVLKERPSAPKLIAQMPQRKSLKDMASIELYINSASDHVDLLGTCDCEICEAKPWESWR